MTHKLQQIIDERIPVLAKRMSMMPNAPACYPLMRLLLALKLNYLFRTVPPELTHEMAQLIEVAMSRMLMWSLGVEDLEPGRVDQGAAGASKTGDAALQAGRF